MSANKVLLWTEGNSWKNDDQIIGHECDYCDNIISAQNQVFMHGNIKFVDLCDKCFIKCDFCDKNPMYMRYNADDDRGEGLCKLHRPSHHDVNKF